MEKLMVTKNEMVIWTWLVSRGIASSILGLSKMIGHDLKVTSLELKQYLAKDAAYLLGGPEKEVVGTHLATSGDVTGHLMLIHDPKMAFGLIDMQNNMPPGTTKRISEMERSILSEMGNVTGSFFLNTLADASGLNLEISPPTVMIDMAGAILDVALSNILQAQDEIIIARANFGANNRQIDGTFMILPSTEFVTAVLHHPAVQFWS